MSQCPSSSVKINCAHGELKMAKDGFFFLSSEKYTYEDCSNMNASSFITFFTYMLRQNGKCFYKGLYVIFKLAPDLKKNTVYLSSYSPLNKGHVIILTNSMHRTYTSDVDKHIILCKQAKFLEIFNEVSPYSYIMIL